MDRATEVLVQNVEKIKIEKLNTLLNEETILAWRKSIFL
jgi:hypothetical protein